MAKVSFLALPQQGGRPMRAERCFRQGAGMTARSVAIRYKPTIAKARCGRAAMSRKALATPQVLRRNRIRLIATLRNVAIICGPEPVRI